MPVGLRPTPRFPEGFALGGLASALKIELRAARRALERETNELCLESLREKWHGTGADRPPC